MARKTGIVRTARGDYIDMNKITRENPTEVAMTGGGLSMNARGDILGRGGKIIKTREDLERSYNAANAKATKHVTAKPVSIKKAHIAPDRLPKEDKLPIEQSKTAIKAPTVSEKVIDDVKEISLEEIADVIKEKQDKQESTSVSRRKRKTIDEDLTDE